MRKILPSILILTFLMPNTAYLQEDDKLAQILESLNEKKTVGLNSSEISAPEQSGYKSFVQNELQNIFSQIDALSQREKDDITFAEINEKRIELATSLCTRDQRACFLVDEYRSYESQEDFPEALLFVNYDYLDRPKGLFDELIRDAQYEGYDTVFPGYVDYGN